MVATELYIETAQFFYKTESFSNGIPIRNVSTFVSNSDFTRSPFVKKWDRNDCTTEKVNIWPHDGKAKMCLRDGSYFENCK